MSCTVNLVPALRSSARARTRRRGAWITVCAAVSVLLGIGWGTHLVACQALARLSQHVRALELRRTTLETRLSEANRARTELLDKLELIAGARRPQPWARRLLDLVQAAPDGVFLTSLNVAATSAADPNAGRTNRTARKEGTPPDASAPAPRTEEQTVRLAGYALDHAALLQFVDALRAVPAWRNADLVRANREPYGSGLAVAFQLDCRLPEDAP